MAAATITALVAAGPAWGTTTLTTPADGSRTDGTPTFSGTATPDGTVTVNIWGGTNTAGPLTRTFNTPSAGGTYSVPLPGAALPSGTYTAQAELSPGDRSTPSTFAVDRTAPNVSITTPAAGGRVNDPTPQLSGVAGTATGDLTTVSIRILSGATQVKAFDVTRNGSSWSGAPSALADGSYTLEVTQRDDLGNVRTVTRAFEVDTTPPVLTITSPADGATTADTTPGLSGAAGNAGGDSTNVVVKIFAGATASGTPIQTITVVRNGAAWSAGAGELSAGQYTVQASQADDLTNASVAQSTFTVGTIVTPGGGVTPTPTPEPSPAPTPVADGPVLLSPFPIVRIVGNLTLRGVRLTLFTVRAPATSTVQVRCRGKSCPFKTRTSKTGSKTRTVRIKQLVGRALRAGVVIEVRVTQKGRWGKFTRFRIRKNKSPARLDSCLRPGKSTPVRCPA